MARTPGTFSRSRRPIFPLAVGLLVIIALLPARWTGFLGVFGRVLDVLVAPAQWPVAAGVRALRGAARIPPPVDPEKETLRHNAEGFERLYLQALEENGRLRTALGSMQRGAALVPGLAVEQYGAEVIGMQADATTLLLKIKLEAGRGASRETVAVFDGVHLVGKVIDSDARIARVLPITDRSGGKLDGVIVLGDGSLAMAGGGAGGAGGAIDPLETALRCVLAPAGDGTLSGPVEVPATRPEMVMPEVRPGMVVRLEGARWPAAARMLIIGRVERVDAGANGRPFVTVRPAYDLAELSSVIMRTRVGAGGAGGAGGGAP